MNLIAQWAVLLVLAGAFLGSSWFLARSRARRTRTGDSTGPGGVKGLLASFTVADWAVVALGVAFLIPLMVRTFAAL